MTCLLSLLKPDPARRSIRRLPSARAAVLLAALLAPAALLAAPVLRCQIEQGGNSRQLDFTPVDDPYTVKAVDINGRFRFKAVMVGDAGRVAYIKLYVYSQTRRQPVLLHVAKYMAPLAVADAAPAALTGINYVYSNQLERELQYGCALLEQTP